MQRFTLSGTSAALNATGFASNVTGATWTLTATNCGDGLAHKVTIHNDAATDHSAKTALLTGTDANDNVLTETMSLPGGTLTTTSTNYFKTLTSIVPSATVGADTMDIGWNASSTTNWYYPKTPREDVFNIGFGCRVVTGSPTYTVQHTYDGISWFNHSVVAAKTADADGTYTSPVAAVRLSFTAAGGVSMVGLQADGSGT